MPSGTRPRSEAVASPSSPTAPAEHIFISYAWENRVVADWLTLRLTAAGYRVWCDRFKMLGGERFPAQIDHAIKHQTFRMLGLLSRHSLHKPNPVNERTLALAIARERNIDFYIPLDLEGLTATDLNWMISSIRDRQRYALHPSTPLGGARSRAGPGDRANVAHRMRP